MLAPQFLADSKNRIDKYQMFMRSCCNQLNSDAAKVNMNKILFGDVNWFGIENLIYYIKNPYYIIMAANWFLDQFEAGINCELKSGKLVFKPYSNQR